MKDRPVLSSVSRTLGIALAMLIGGLLTACSSTATPSARIVDVAIHEENDRAMVLRFDLVLANPNPHPVPLGQVRYQLELDGRRVFSGTRTARITIPRSGDQSLTLPAAFELHLVPSALDRPVSYRLTGSILYRPDGTFGGVLYDSKVHRPATRFSASGMLDFSPAARTGPFPEPEQR